ncbi:MAG: response regulator [Verrucomicrobiae bacterium]|nr:response regulator [Verrucomicrobiae bacterium]
MLVEQASAGNTAASLIPDLERIGAAARDLLAHLDNLPVTDWFEALRTARPAVTSLTRPDALALSRHAHPVQPPPEASRRARVLLVDDDPGNLELLSRRLGRQGHRVRTAANARAAIEALHEELPDLILLDLIMPDIGGDRLLAEFKAHPVWHEVPVIMLSALDEMDSVVRCLLMGAEDYLAKPVNPVLLHTRIDTCLERCRLRKQERAYLETIEAERRKSELLLHNILPDAIAARLKHGETTIVDTLAEVTVLFADVVGFTELTRRISSVELVRWLDDLFSGFDLLAEQQRLEKIKTIGDAYMVVGGLPSPRPDHAAAIARLALGLVEHMSQHSHPFPVPVQLRVGIHTGPVVAGIIGRNRFSYDLWGATVNLASRMEASSLPGRIHVTDAFRRAVGAGYTFEPRGNVEVRDHGVMPTWFLQSASRKWGPDSNRD